MRVVRLPLFRLLLIAIAAVLPIVQAKASVESNVQSICKKALLDNNVVEETESAEDAFERHTDIDFSVPAISIVGASPIFYPRFEELCPTLLVLRTGVLRFLHTSLSPPSHA